MGKNTQGVAIIYIQKHLADAISKDWVNGMPGWEEEWKKSPDAELTPRNTDLEQELDSRRVVPVTGTERKLDRFGLPVRADLDSFVTRHILSLYKEATSLREVFKQAKKARGGGTKSNKIPLVQKLDPPVLWVICTQGCRHMAFGVIFQDLDIYTRTHKHWCCDWCHFHPENPGRNNQQVSRPEGNSAATSLHSDISHSILYPEPEPLITKKKKKTSTTAGRKENITPRHKANIRHRLEVLREFIWRQLPFPDTYPCIVVPDKVLGYVTAHLKTIESVDDLKRVMVSGGLNAQLSLLTDAMLQAMLKVIEGELSQKYPDVPILPKPPVPVTQPQSATNCNSCCLFQLNHSFRIADTTL